MPINLTDEQLGELADLGLDTDRIYALTSSTGEWDGSELRQLYLSLDGGSQVPMFTSRAGKAPIHGGRFLHDNEDKRLTQFEALWAMATPLPPIKAGQ